LNDLIFILKIRKEQKNHIIKGGNMSAVQFEKKGAVGIITINRPKANQLSLDVREGFASSLDQCESDSEIRVVIITGSGDKIFCSGADLAGGFGGDEAVDFLRKWQELYNRIEGFSKPVIAAMNGHAFGGGCELSMTCHLRVMKKGARVGLTETNLGIMPGYGGTMRLPRLIGHTKALECILLGKELDADDAHKLGLVNMVSETDALSDAMELAEKLAARPPLAVKAILSIFASRGSMSSDEHLKIERESLASLFSTKDTAEGITAFMQKRPPVFKGE